MAAPPWASPTAGATTLGQLIKSSAIFNLRNTWSINKQRTSSFLPCTLLRSRIPSFPSVSVAADGADSPFDLSPPPIEHEYIDAITVPGAIISDNRVTETFQNDEAALDAANHGVAVVDLSDWGRIRVSGEDRIQFLHNQSTADFECLREGQGCDTVFVTPTARTIDIAYAWIMRNAIILTLSPQTCKDIREMLAKYIFFADKVEIQDITSQTCLFVLVGPLSNQVMESLGLNSIVGCPYGTHHHFQVNGMPITVGVGNLISEAGYSMMMAPDAAKLVWTKLIGQNVIPMGSNAWERLRIHQGRPTPGKELTSEFNVLEAGLWNMISTNKGCYKGQETISRLITYNGVKQSLYGIILSGPAQPGSAITIGGTRVGKLTSCTVGRYGPDHIGLGYIKRKAASTGGRVVVGDDVVGTLVDVPYLAWQSAPLRNPI